MTFFDRRKCFLSNDRTLNMDASVPIEKKGRFLINLSTAKIGPIIISVHCPDSRDLLDQKRELLMIE